MHNFGLTAVTVPQAEEYGEGNILQKQFSQIVEKEIRQKSMGKETSYKNNSRKLLKKR